MIEYDIAVIGAGIAGLTAADSAIESGAKTVLIDEFEIDPYDLPESPLLSLLPNTIAWGLYSGFQIGITGRNGQSTIAAKRVILATGTTEMAFSFPGSDLPGVMTGRGLMRMLTEHRVWPGGKRVVIVGWSEEADELAALVTYLGGEVAYWAEEPDIEIEALATDRVLSDVRIDGAEYATDIIAIAIGEQPDIALAAMIECETGYSDELGGFVPRRSNRMECSISGLFVCGSAAGIGSEDEFEEEGRLAGRAAAQSLGLISEEALHETIVDFEGAFGERVQAAKAIESSWTQHDVSRSIAAPIGEF